MSEHIHKSHNVSVLLHHPVCPTKYCRAVVTEEVEAALRQVCIDIGNRFEITFLETGADDDHVHFLVQSVPTYSPKKIVQTIKNIRAHGVSGRVPSVKARLHRHGRSPQQKETIREYVASKGRQQEYRRLHLQPLEPPDRQLELF